MFQLNPKEFYYVFKNGKKKYYIHNFELYTSCFPEEWASNHVRGTGPKDCDNCKEYGSLNEVFIGYCSNCAFYEYKGKRGRGFISYGVENTSNDVKKFSSVFKTYLKNINLENVGNMNADDISTATYDVESNSFDIKNNPYDYAIAFIDKNVNGEKEQDILEKKNEENCSNHILQDDFNDSDSLTYSESSEYQSAYYDPHDDCFEYGPFSDGLDNYGYGSNYNGGYDSY